MMNFYKKIMVVAIALVAMTTSATAQTASDKYLDMANYETVGTSQDPSSIDHIYHCTVTSATTAWVTMSVYGAVHYSYSNKDWMESTNNQSTYYIGSVNQNSPWNANSPFLGYNAYFNNNNGRVWGRGSDNERVVSFYVTNITGVKIMGRNMSNNSQKITSMTIYECTKNADGSLTASSSSTYTTSNNSKNEAFTFSYLNLDKNKYYKITCRTYYGYFYEIAFRMSIPEYIDATITDALYSTLYCDFPVLIPNNPNLFNVLYPTDVSGKSLVLRQISDNIPAKTGVILFGNKGTYRFYMNTGAVTPLTDPNLLTGTGKKITRAQALARAGKTEDNAIIMTLSPGKTSAIGFFKYTGNTLAANKAYLVYDTDAGSNITFLSISGSEEETDGISQVTTSHGDGAWHTLQGVRLEAAPTQPGIYIHGGKKVVVK